MNKIIKIAASLALLAVLPVAALAHEESHVGVKADVKAEVKSNNGLHLGWLKDHNGDGDGEHADRKLEFKRGVVTSVSVSGNSFVMTAENGGSFAVNVANAKITTAFKGNIQLADIKVNDKVSVVGEINGSQITAKFVVVTPANTHPARGSGTVTALSGSSFTLKTEHEGIVSFVTVNTNSNTTVLTKDHATTTLASVQVGSKVNVRGLWDEILNVLNAIVVKIRM